MNTGNCVSMCVQNNVSKMELTDAYALTFLDKRNCLSFKTLKVGLLFTLLTVCSIERQCFLPNSNRCILTMTKTDRVNKIETSHSFVLFHFLKAVKALHMPFRSCPSVPSAAAGDNGEDRGGGDRPRPIP